MDKHPKRNYLGLSCSGHDNALAIVDSKGVVVFAEATERTLQSKRALDSPPDAMLGIASLVETYCEPGAELVVCKSWSENAQANVAKSVAEIERAIAKLKAARASAGSERAQSTIDFLLRRERAYLHTAMMHSASNAGAGRNLCYHFQDRGVVVRSYEHHLTHAAMGCFTSPFAEAVCVVVDGMGEGVTTNCYRYRDGRIGRLDDRGGSSADLAGLGLFYVDLCSLCGFDHWRGEEWKVMGLAAYGDHDPRLCEILRQCLQLEGLQFRRSSSEATGLARLWHGVAGEPRLGARSADLAFAGQHVFEDLLFTLCRRAKELSNSEFLVLTGGCALNSSANGKLLEATGFRGLYVPCAPADDGNAVGAALLGYLDDHPSQKLEPAFQSPFLGARICRETLERAAQLGGFKRVVRLDEAELCDTVAARLCEGSLVGWVQGRAEFGPRALGNRSILADPRRAEMKDRINQAVKFRETFRPFAPAILAEYGSQYFEAYQESAYMERTLKWRPDVRDKVPAVVHVDGTGRLQSVRREWNPRFHRLLTRFHHHSGVPVLVNTSFNVMGKPIVHSVEDALAVFCTSGLDLLVIEDHLFEKH